MSDATPLPPTRPREGVVVACRRRDGRWLLVRRSAAVSRAPLKIGFPGGEIEPGESQTEAVVREVAEEIGIRVHPVRCVWRHDRPDGVWRLWGWYAQMLTTRVRPAPQEVAEILWLDPREAASHPDGLPTNRLFLAGLRRFEAGFEPERP